MLDNNLIIIPFQLPWDWSADYQRQTCLELAKHNIVIAYVDNDARYILKPRPKKAFPDISNIVFFQPRYIIPFRRFALIEKLNQLLNIAYLSWRYGKGRRIVLWIFDPVFWFYPFVRYILPKTVSLYDCVDYVWSQDRSLRKRLSDMEKKLIINTHYFFVNSHVLANHHAKIRKPDAIVPQGFQLNKFRRPITSPITAPSDKPIIGFVGTLDDRIDWALLESLVQRNPQWLFVLWGPRKTDRLIFYIFNVIVGESADRREVAAIVKQFTIGMIPYSIKHLGAKYSYPMKLFEYFYMGKPVVAAPIEELKRFPNYVRVGKKVYEWEQHIATLLADPWPRQYKNQQRILAKENSWEKKIHATLRYIT